jgi:hypothetical protein
MPVGRLPADLPPIAPPAEEQPIKVSHFPSPRWRGKVAAHLTVDAWEWSWYRLIQPSDPNRYIHGNGSKAPDGEKAYARIGEEMPAQNAEGCKEARHTLQRYLHALRELLLFKAGLGPEPNPRGPPVWLRDGDPCNLLPSNRAVMAADRPDDDRAAPKRRRGHDDAWSVRVRLDAVLAGKDPDKAMQSAVRKSKRQAAARAKARAAKEAGR